jgi:molybdate transport system substrate-binding protein
MTFLRVALATLFLTVTASAKTIRVAVAISLKDAVEAIASDYTTTTGEKLEFTFGSSGQLLAQIQNGADIDLFISAAEKQVSDLQKAGLAIDRTRRVVAGNTLVLVVPAGATNAPTSFESLNPDSVTKVAIGEPVTVPAGQYASQVLTKLGLTDRLKDKIVYGANVRQVLSYVERGEVSAGILYATDARESGDKVRIVATAPAGTHEPIVYPAVVVKTSKKPDVAERFLNYLGSENARKILIEKGFSAPIESAKKP